MIYDDLFKGDGYENFSFLHDYYRFFDNIHHFFMVRRAWQSAVFEWSAGGSNLAKPHFNGGGF